MKRTQYFKWGLTAFLTVCAVLVFYDTFYQAGTLQQFVSKLASILAPVLYGFAIAYLLTPIMSCLERAIAALWKKLFKKELKQPSGALRLVSILLTEAVVIFLLYLLMSVLVPQVVDSVTTLINNAESYYRKVYRWANDLLESVVEEQAQGMSVRQEDKAFIATLYKYMFVGLMLDWIKSDMKGDPALMVERLEQVIHGSVSAALGRLRTDKPLLSNPAE